MPTPSSGNIVSISRGRTSVVPLTDMIVLPGDFCPFDERLGAFGSVLGGYPILDHWHLFRQNCVAPPFISYPNVDCSLGGGAATYILSSYPTNPPFISPGTGGVVVTGDLATEVSITLPDDLTGWIGINAFAAYPSLPPPENVYGYALFLAYTYVMDCGVVGNHYYKVHGAWLKLTSTQPPPPTDLVADEDCDTLTVLLTWDPADPSGWVTETFLRYELYRNGMLIYSGTTPSFTDSITGGVTYEYTVRVVALSNDGTTPAYELYSELSNIEAVECGGCTQQPVSNLSGSVHCCFFYRTIWTAAAGADYYNVFLVSDDGVFLVGTTTGTSYDYQPTEAEVRSGVTIRVVAVGPCGNSTVRQVAIPPPYTYDSEPVSAYTTTPDPDCPGYNTDPEPTSAYDYSCE